MKYTKEQQEIIDSKVLDGILFFDGEMYLDKGEEPAYTVSLLKKSIDRGKNHIEVTRDKRGFSVKRWKKNSENEESPENLTDDGEGNFVFFHTSNEDFSEIDPNAKLASVLIYWW